MGLDCSGWGNHLENGHPHPAVCCFPQGTQMIFNAAKELGQLSKLKVRGRRSQGEKTKQRKIPVLRPEEHVKRRLLSMLRRGDPLDRGSLDSQMEGTDSQCQSFCPPALPATPTGSHGARRSEEPDPEAVRRGRAGFGHHQGKGGAPESFKRGHEEAGFKDCIRVYKVKYMGSGRSAFPPVRTASAKVLGCGLRRWGGCEACTSAEVLAAIRTSPCPSSAILPRGGRGPQEDLSGEESRPSIPTLRPIALHAGHRPAHQNLRADSVRAR